MHSLLALATPLAMLLPLLGQSGPVAAGSAIAGAETSEVTKAPAERAPTPLRVPRYPAPATSIAPLDAFRGGQVLRQIRIEQRVIVRISPRRSQNRTNLFAQQPRQSLNTRYEERRMDKCLAVNEIAGVQTGSGNRLLLFMRNQEIVSANLEKACRARDFYSGFYVEKNADGKLCIDRDKLQSRTGAKCEVARMRQLVAVED